MAATAPRPIGFWLKLLDGLLEEHFERALVEERLDRRGWQVLSSVAAGVRDRDGVHEAVAPFLRGDPGAAVAALDPLIGRGWVDDIDGELTLSATGLAAHGRLQERVQASRRSFLTGVTDDEYLSVLATLEQIARNLGWSDEADGATHRLR